MCRIIFKLIFVEKFVQTELAKREALEKDLKSAELIIVRLRSERDGYKQQYEAMKQNQFSPQVVKELESIVTAKDNELKRLKEQVCVTG